MNTHSTIIHKLIVERLISINFITADRDIRYRDHIRIIANLTFPRFLYTVIKIIIDSNTHQRGSIISCIFSLGYCRWSPIETGGYMPMLVAERKDIHQQLEILHRRLTFHIHITVYLKCEHLIQGLREFVKLLILYRRIGIITHLHPEVHGLLIMRKEVETGAHLHHFTNRHCQIYTHASGSQSDRTIQMIENVLISLITRRLYRLCKSTGSSQ